MKPTLNDLLDAYEFAAKRFGKGTGFTNEVADLRAMIDADLAAQSAKPEAQRQAGQEPIGAILVKDDDWLLIRPVNHPDLPDGQFAIYTAPPAVPVPIDEALRLAAERTRDDLGPQGDNYPAVRKLLAFAEAHIKALLPPKNSIYRGQKLEKETTK